MVGYDVQDPLTGESLGHKLPANYTQFLDSRALRGARIGVLRSMSDVPFADPEVLDVYENAIDDLSRQGACLSGWYRDLACPICCRVESKTQGPQIGCSVHTPHII